ncbi:MAG: hypothetical protein ACNI25_03335 [Halarcobacter sp.]
MSYKKWVNNLFLNLILLCMIFFIFTFVIYDKFTNRSLINKEYLIVDNSPKIVFAGDSRAERQLNVEAARKILNYKNGDIVNIAISSGDPIMINNLIDRFPDKFKNTTLVISISANQMNDNAKEYGFFTESMISKLSYFEQVNIFQSNPEVLLRYYFNNIKYHILNKINLLNVKKDYQQTFGFNGIENELDLKQLNIKRLMKNPWYLNYVDGGIKYKLINDSLKDIKNKVKKLYVYTAPFSPTYLKIVQNTKLLDYELSFKNRISEICKNNGIKFKNYLHIKELTDQYFYDMSHLNKKGSLIFTKIILNDFSIK